MAAFHFVDLPGHGRVSRDSEPDTCPHCGRTVHAVEVTSYVIVKDGAATGQEAVYQCPFPACGRIFIALFALEQRSLSELMQALGRPQWVFSLKDTEPKRVARAVFPQGVQDVSPSFCEIYGQAERAEAHELLQICGLGYRKAVEYLVKDFCIAQHPGDEDRIKAMLLAPCIREFVGDVNVKACAERAVWLGNDEAHYVRKWVDHDVEDMKTLIRLTSNWIDSVLLTKEYQARMQR